MAVYKCNYVFSGPDHGWRETWFIQQSFSSGLQAALALFATTVGSRRLLLGAQASIKAIEASCEQDDVGNPVLNDSILQYVYQNGYSSEDCADLDLTVVTNCSTTLRNHSRNVYLRGFWDSIEVQGGKYVPPPGSTWTAKYNSWVAAMAAIGVGYLNGIKSVGFPITTYTQLVDGQVGLTFAAPGPWAAGVPSKPVQIRINTSRQKSVLSGIQIVQPLTATTANTVDKIAVFPFTGVGWRAFTYTKQFLITPNIDPRRIGRRAVGRPLLVTAGRARRAARG
jgi:hypothetical protein